MSYIAELEEKLQKNPLKMAYTREAYVVQLVMLLELQGYTNSREFYKEAFIPGPMSKTYGETLTLEWALRIFKMYLNRKPQPTS